MSITIDLKRWTYEGTAEAVAPLLPGTVLVAGWLIANPQLAYRLFVGELPVVLKIGAPLILAYTAGFVLMYVSQAFLGGLYGILEAAAKARGIGVADDRAEFWARTHHFRRMARAFIDAKLLPKHLDSIFFQDIWDSEVKMAEQLPEPMKSQQLFEINKKHRALKLSDLEWAEVYRMFQDLYFPKWGVSTATARLYLNVVNSVGWTLVILLALCPSYRHWPMIAGAILLTFLGILMTVAVLFNVVQVSAVWPSLLCARMLKDILRLKHSDADAASQSELE